jgi:hypothetical protein
MHPISSFLILQCLFTNTLLGTVYKGVSKFVQRFLLSVVHHKRERNNILLKDKSKKTKKNI